MLNLLKILHQIDMKAHHSFLPVLDGEPPPFTMLWHENSGHWVFLYLVCIGWCPRPCLKHLQGEGKISEKDRIWGSPSLYYADRLGWRERFKYGEPNVNLFRQCTLWFFIGFHCSPEFLLYFVKIISYNHLTYKFFYCVTPCQKSSGSVAPPDPPKEGNSSSNPFPPLVVSQIYLSIYIYTSNY